MRRGGRVAEGGGLLNRYRALKPYRGFESPSLRQFLSSIFRLETNRIKGSVLAPPTKGENRPKFVWVNPPMPSSAGPPANRHAHLRLRCKRRAVPPEFDRQCIG